MIVPGGAIVPRGTILLIGTPALILSKVPLLCSRFAEKICHYPRVGYIP
jgi:hypothetical protein